jgi:hypothetical protein
MTSKYISAGLIIALSLVLALPARADSLKTDSHEIVAGIAGVAAAIAVSPFTIRRNGPSRDVSPR